MNASDNYWEIPNLAFVQNLALTDADFQGRFIAKVKEEFSKYFSAYQNHIELEEPRAAAEAVHRLKYTFGFLGMQKSIEIATSHEERLHVGNIDLHQKFKRILTSIEDFLSKN